MNQQERTEKSVQILVTSALWYAWGQIDATLHSEGFGTEHGQEFSGLYEQLTRDYSNEQRTSRPSVPDAWRQFVTYKREFGPDVTVTAEQLMWSDRISSSSHKPVVVVVGNPVDGFRAYGPAVPNTKAIKEFTDRADDVWVYMPLSPLDAR